MVIYTKDLTKGDRATLADYGSTHSEYRRRLLSLGLTRGAEIRVIRTAPLGCPLQVEVRGTFLTLRKEEASCLTWKRL